MIVIVNKKVLYLAVVVLVVLLLASGGIFLFAKKAEPLPTLTLQSLEKPIEAGREDSKFIAFACNVDWGNEVIPDMLKVFEEKDVKITFFVTGRWAKNYPELYQSIVAAGHEIGSHGYEHVDYSTLSYEKNKEQIQQAEAVLMGALKEKPVLFAPPSGAYNEHTLKAAKELGYKTILWSIDTIDWRKGSSKDVILKRVLDKEVFNGKIVLMHPMEETAKALPELIDQLQSKGVQVGRVSDVL